MSFSHPKAFSLLLSAELKRPTLVLSHISYYSHIATILISWNMPTCSLFKMIAFSFFQSTYHVSRTFFVWNLTITTRIRPPTLFKCRAWLVMRPACFSECAVTHYLGWALGRPETKGTVCDTKEKVGGWGFTLPLPVILCRKWNPVVGKRVWNRHRVVDCVLDKHIFI